MSKPPIKASLRMEGGCLKLSGIVDKHSVSELYRQSQHLDNNEMFHEVCLDKVEHIDSTGLALLLEWRAWSKEKSRPIRLLNAPKQLKQLAELSELEASLGLETV